jgi:hypothetical protein
MEAYSTSHGKSGKVTLQVTRYDMQIPWDVVNVKIAHSNQTSLNLLRGHT